MAVYMCVPVTFKLINIYYLPVSAQKWTIVISIIEYTYLIGPVGCFSDYPHHALAMFSFVLVISYIGQVHRNYHGGCVSPRKLFMGVYGGSICNCIVNRLFYSGNISMYLFWHLTKDMLSYLLWLLVNKTPSTIFSQIFLPLIWIISLINLTEVGKERMGCGWQPALTYFGVVSCKC